ncbi:MAG: ester cyclase [Candidatus Hodarchaeota archaeon]
MANKVKLAREFFKASEDEDLDKIARMITDDFQFVGPLPEPLNKTEYLGFLESLMPAFSDWRFNLSSCEEVDDKVSCFSSISGKHTGELAPPNMNPIPATNRTFKLPKETTTLVFSGDKISKLESAASEDGGMSGIIKQLTA